MFGEEFDFLPGASLMIDRDRLGFCSYFNTVGRAGGASARFHDLLWGFMDRHRAFVESALHPTADPIFRVARWTSDGDAGSYEDWRVDIALRRQGSRESGYTWAPYALRAEKQRLPENRSRPAIWEEVGAFTEPREPYLAWGGLTSMALEGRLEADGAWERARWLQRNGWGGLVGEDKFGFPQEIFPEDIPGGAPYLLDVRVQAGAEALGASRRVGKHQTLPVKWMPPRGVWRMA